MCSNFLSRDSDQEHLGSSAVGDLGAAPPPLPRPRFFLYYVLKVVAESTEDFARIHRQYLARLPGVAQMQSSFALRTVFKTTALPI